MKNLTVQSSFIFRPTKGNRGMNKVFLYVGFVTLFLVAAAILTRPTETDYSRYLEEQEKIICSGKDFACVREDTGEKLELVETNLQNRVFFIVIEKTFQGERDTKTIARAFGMFHMFFNTSIEKVE